jgi:hypothetical protein
MTTKDHILRGYYIPKGSIIIANIWYGFVKARVASARLIRQGICFMTPRNIPIQNVSIQSASSQETINLQNEILEHVFLALVGGKPSSIVHSTNTHT